MAGKLVGADPQQPENAATEPRVADNPRASRYELWLGTTRAGLIQYRSEPGVVFLIHTEVDPAFAGRPPRPWAQARPALSVRPCLPAPPSRPGRPGRW
jgi:hypothetical protein